jgi:hypothetical protein
MTLRMGVARRDASPRHPVQLAGFGSRKGASVSRIAHPIMLRVAVVTGTTGERLALVSGEFLNWSTESDGRFRAIVAESAGVSPEDILFSATHTHSAPQLSHLQAETLGVADDAYLDDVARLLADASREAGAGERVVVPRRVVGRHGLAMQRRAELDLSVDPAPPRIDDRLTVIRFDAGDDPVACFVHYACHPVVSAENAVSGDFFGIGVARVEELTGAVAFPLQGCAGDVNPGDNAFGGIERAAGLGREFADAVMGLLAGPAETLRTGTPYAAWASTELPLVDIATEAVLHETSTAPGLDGQWARALLTHPDLLRPSVTARLQLWSLGDELQLLGMNGEVTSEYGLRIRERSGGTTLPVAYSNGMIGYLPTARQIAAGGYEVDVSARCYLLPGTFDPVIENRLNDAVDSLVPTAGVA